MAAKLHRKIKTAEPVVGFVSGEESDGWTRYLTLHGERAFIIGGRCQTCAFVFERISSNYLSPTAFADAISWAKIAPTGMTTPASRAAEVTMPRSLW